MFVTCIVNRVSCIYLNRLCLGAWSDHGERTGGFYACNRYEAAKQEGVVREINVLILIQFFMSSLIWLVAFTYDLEYDLITLYCMQYDEAERRREMAKNSLERYTHYYERWASNQSVCYPNLC